MRRTAALGAGEVADPVVGHESARCPALDSGGRCPVPANREVALRLDVALERLSAVMDKLGACEVAAGQTLDEGVRLLQILAIQTFAVTHREE
ncbi:hypothetical protein AB0P40_15185 [Streptomyces sp. NPDC079189]|uniref:hypothetical protein n=1 Tax=unclassified Streptomyces TaxID=2593676 RepID=UPI00339FAC70